MTLNLLNFVLLYQEFNFPFTILKEHYLNIFLSKNMTILNFSF